MPRGIQNTALGGEEPITISDGSPIKITWRDEGWKTQGKQIVKSDPEGKTKAVTGLSWNNGPTIPIGSLNLDVCFQYGGDDTQYILTAFTNDDGTKLKMKLTADGRAVKFGDQFQPGPGKSFVSVRDAAINCAEPRFSAALKRPFKAARRIRKALNGNRITIEYGVELSAR